MQRHIDKAATIARPLLDLELDDSIEPATYLNHHAFFADDATALAAQIRAKRQSAERETALAVLVRIADLERALNCFTSVLRDFALAQADAVDRAVAAGDDPGLSPVFPFAVKNLFDVVVLTTLAGSKIHTEQPPATRDATAVRRLRQCGAALVGALNMDE